MAKLNRVAHARKDQGKCGKCGVELKKGEPYVWWSFRFGGRYVRCTKSECQPRYSEYVSSSPYLQQLYGAQETAEDSLAALSGSVEPQDYSQILQDTASAAEDVASQYQESIDALSEVFSGGSSKIDEIEESKANVEAWQEALESAANDIESETKEEGQEDEEFAEHLATLTQEAISELQL